MAVNTMMHKHLIYFAIFILLTALIAGCSNTKTPTGNACLDSGDDSGVCIVEANSSSKEISIDKLEVYHFHGTHQCYSCITVGNYAEETVNTYFADELKSGKIVFRHINAELAENMAVVVKYGVTGSSLWFGKYKDDEFSAEQNINVWYKLSNKKACIDYLKGIIEQKLKGE